jgi:hypothetical protein
VRGGQLSDPVDILFDSIRISMSLTQLNQIIEINLYRFFGLSSYLKHPCALFFYLHNTGMDLINAE